MSEAHITFALLNIVQRVSSVRQCKLSSLERVVRIKFTCICYVPGKSCQHSKMSIHSLWHRVPLLHRVLADTPGPSPLLAAYTERTQDSPRTTGCVPPTKAKQSGWFSFLLTDLRQEPQGLIGARTPRHPTSSPQTHWEEAPFSGQASPGSVGAQSCHPLI